MPRSQGSAEFPMHPNYTEGEVMPLEHNPAAMTQPTPLDLDRGKRLLEKMHEAEATYEPLKRGTSKESGDAFWSLRDSTREADNWAANNLAALIAAAERANLFDEAIATMSGAIDEILHCFTVTGKIKGGGQWRLE